MKKTISVIVTNSLVIVFCFISSVSFGQVSKEVENSFKNYQQTLQEKIFVHTDRNTYVVGEMVWFKIYYIDGTHNKPLNVSKVAYVDILDKENNPVLQAKIELKAGTGNGSVYLPSALNSGNYKLRCYTGWMKNFDPDFYFEKLITVLNPLNAPIAATKNKTTDYDIQFFPEGGNLVNNLTSKIAFRVVDSEGAGVLFNGNILDQDNRIVMGFQPLKSGIGSFLFKPEKNNSYKASLIIDGKTITKDLPQASDRGYVLNVSKTTDNQVKIVINSSNPDETNTLHFFAHTRQDSKISQNILFKNGKAELIFDQNKLGEGISHFMLFDAYKQPICERLYFKYPIKKLAITAKPNQGIYKSRSKANIEISTAGINNQETANLSMAVYKIDSLDNSQDFKILSYFLLSSDLKGNIESPDSYFGNNDNASGEAIDNLMLTHGWSRFNWTNISNLQPNTFNYIPDYNGLIIKGKIIDSLSNLPKQNAQTYLSIPGKRIQFHTYKSDASGGILFNPKNLYGLNEIIIQANSEKESSYKIELSNPFSELFSNKTFPEINTALLNKEQLISRSISMQTQNAYFGNKVRNSLPPANDTSSFYEGYQKSYNLDDYTRFASMEEVLREYVPDVVVGRSQKKYHFKVYVPTKMILMEENPLALIDGVPTFNMDKIIKTDPLKINYLEVVPYKYYFGSLVSDGIVSLKSYNGNMGNQMADSLAMVIDYEGLQLKREFFSPVYEVDSQVSSRLPDFRNLLYWSPDISCKNKTVVNFYTSDDKGKYIGVVQGITSGGIAGSTVFTFEVKDDSL